MFCCITHIKLIEDAIFYQFILICGRQLETLVAHELNVDFEGFIRKSKLIRYHSAARWKSVSWISETSNTEAGTRPNT